MVRCMVLLLIVMGMLSVHVLSKFTVASGATDQWSDQVWQCLARNATGAMVSTYIINRVDPGFESNIKSILRAQYSSIDGSIYLAPNLGRTTPPSTIITAVNAELFKLNVRLSTVYLVLSDDQKNWYTSQTENFNYLLEFTRLAKSAGWNVGIYADQRLWNQLIGGLWDDSWEGLKVWYIGDSAQNFADWPAMRFGQISTPSLKMISIFDACHSQTVVKNWSPN